MEFMFVPANFVENLRYMGFGMLGIFLALGVIALVTVILNAAGNKKKDKDQEEK